MISFQYARLFCPLFCPLLYPTLYRPLVLAPYPLIAGFKVADHIIKVFVYARPFLSIPVLSGLITRRSVRVILSRCIAVVVISIVSRLISRLFRFIGWYFWPIRLLFRLINWLSWFVDWFFLFRFRPRLIGWKIQFGSVLSIRISVFVS